MLFLSNYFEVKILIIAFFDTGCTDNADCAALPNSVCDAIVTATCACTWALGFIANTNSDGCVYGRFLTAIVLSSALIR